ncbi:MAG: hypothetical protein HFJ28_05570 [Clostridia bacterium]|nr:hypothetical protein [Clostridia bacterium]
MLWIILIASGIAAFIAFFCMCVDIWEMEWYDLKEHGIKFVICLAVCSIAWVSLEGIYILRYEESNQTAEYNLVALQDYSQIKGQGAGGLFYVHISIDTVEVYSYYYQLENGGYKQGKIKAQSAVIFEQDDSTPHILVTTVDVKNKMPKWLQIILTFGFPNKQYNTYELYVPKGSVIQDFVLDLQP